MDTPVETARQLAPTPRRVADPCVVTIFGASGDLTKRKLIPALCNLARDKLLPDEFAVVGFARSDFSDASFREQLATDAKALGIDVDPAIWKHVMQRVYYVSGAFDDAAAFKKLAAKIDEAANKHRTGDNRLCYLAVAPRFFGGIVCRLGEAGMATETEDHWCRVIVEKPFGHDLVSARKLDAEIKQVLKEPQIYRIDHYLGKETVQNLIVFRFSNSIFEPIWNHQYIDHVQITAAETVGVEHRGGYYETAGALRDMMPSHLFQLMAFTAMEPPAILEADAMRDEEVKVLHAAQPLAPERLADVVVRGQYGAGKMNGKNVPAYRKEPDVSPDSKTETYVALKLMIDNWRWAGTPFYLRTGKRMAQHATEIAIAFKRPPFKLFRDTAMQGFTTNELVMRIQPDEGISLRFGAKIPGAVMRQDAVKMDFCYKDYFGTSASTGYERLLHDCMIGDQTLFRRADMVEAAWRILAPVLDAQAASAPAEYAAGTWGPREADALMQRDGRSWNNGDA
ncbi:MAG TPA: glucose-6-phosphate dehydrogenase [Burkholderiales bacterium]|nr:glucose-6-phosphate dehydrogenase [Burkholderiales bacterium]